ncbi:hypothetical protein D3C85_877970 [compost metagenome]
MTYKIQIDNFLFDVNVTEYIPEIPGTWDRRADNPDEFYGFPAELDWECTGIVEFQDYTDTTIHKDSDTFDLVVDAYAERITEQLLMKIVFEQDCAEDVW